jgi:hypothetical protein
MPRPAHRKGTLFSWRDVGEDWMRRLPQLEDKDLRTLTGIHDLQVTIHQPAPNTPVVWALRTSARVESPYARDLPPLTPALDNVLSLGRLPAPGPVDDPVAAYTEAPLEAMAWLRSPRAERDRRDLLLLRVDVAPWLLARLRVAGRAASDSLVGYLARRDPSEGQRINLLVAAVDLGDDPPRDELATLAA